MKKIILSLLFLILINIVNAQYRDYKNHYNVKTYSYSNSDRYNPGLAGFAAVLPGVGHFYTGEVGRGLAFIGGMAGSLALLPIGFVIAWGGDSGALGGVLFIAGAVSFVVLYIWSVIDAVKIAKIKNMAINDRAISFKFEPYFESGTQSKLQSNNFGLSLKMSF